MSIPNENADLQKSYPSHSIDFEHNGNAIQRVDDTSTAFKQPNSGKVRAPHGQSVCRKVKATQEKSKDKELILWHGVVQFDFKYLEYMGTARLFKCGCCVCCFDLYSFYSVFLLANSAAFYNVFFPTFLSYILPISNTNRSVLFLFLLLLFLGWARMPHRLLWTILIYPSCST